MLDRCDWSESKKRFHLLSKRLISSEASESHDCALGMTDIEQLFLATDSQCTV